MTDGGSALANGDGDMINGNQNVPKQMRDQQLVKANLLHLHKKLTLGRVLEWVG